MPPAERLSINGFDEVYRLELQGTVAFVAIHALIRARSFGGIRVASYGAEKEALDDALLLARTMTRKVVLAEIEGGGAKAVVIEPPPERRSAVMAELGAFIESLGGRYWCGGDLGYTSDDDAILRDTTRFVACSDLSSYAALGVLTAMRAVCEPQSVAIQGLGSLGIELAELLDDAGVRVCGSEVRDVSLAASIRRVAPEAIYDLECDVLAPCALGGVINRETIPRLRCRVICGGANNPLATDEDAARLDERSIIYVPDFIANSGATIRGASAAVGEEHLTGHRMAGIATLVRDVLDRAHREGRSTNEVAIALADERLASLRGG